MFKNWPSKYKYTSINLYQEHDLEVTERSTYSVLDWLGDIGGLFGIL